MKSSSFSSAASLFTQYQPQQGQGYVSREFQDFGLRLCNELDDHEHKSLYIKLAKKEPRWLLETALSFVSDAKSANNKARLFMWKVQQLKKEKKAGEQKP